MPCSIIDQVAFLACLDDFTSLNMPPLVALPSRSDAFSDYRPSRNAHTDLLTSKRSGGRIVKIGLNGKLAIGAA